MKSLMRTKIGMLMRTACILFGLMTLAIQAPSAVADAHKPRHHHASPAVKAAFAQCRAHIKKGTTAESKAAWTKSMRNCMANKGFVPKHRSPASQ